MGEKCIYITGVVTVVMHRVLAVDGLVVIVSSIGHGDGCSCWSHGLMAETGNTARSHCSVMVSIVRTQRSNVVAG